MARFEKLEITPAAEPAEAPADRIVERDSAWWMGQADEERRAGHHENALRYYSRALEGDKSLVEGWLGQVQMLILLDECPEAELWSRKALELFPSNGDLLAARAQALCRTGDLKQAHVLSDGALSQSGQSAYRWRVRGELMLAGRQDMDRHCFEKAEQLDPDWLVALEIALTYLHYGRASKALLHTRKAVETGAARPYAWLVHGQCLSELGLAALACQSFERCLDLSPRHAEAERRLREVEQRGWSPLRTLWRWLGRA